jgi:DNA (cytosine-5)-methyltransferase 1
MTKLKSCHYNVVDLFAGCGGASLGFKLAGCRVVGAVDIDPPACKIYSENLDLEPICGDLRQVKGDEILNRYGLEKTDVDIIVGCPPCQGFSSLRRTRRLSEEDNRNDLIIVFLKRIREIQPKVVLFENVPGIATLCEGKYLNLYLERMRRMGYKSVCETLNVADYGIPQHRKRVVAFSVKGADPSEDLSMPPTSHSDPKRAKEIDKLPWTTVRETISNLPALEPGESNPKIANHKARTHEPRVLEIIRNVPKDGGSRKDLPMRLWLKCHRALNDGGAENIYGRMWWDRPSPTITSRCTCPSSGRFIHPEQDRAITPREAARLQTFPDEFIFPDEVASAEHSIGNAVPVDFIANLVRDFIENCSDLQ